MTKAGTEPGFSALKADALTTVLWPLAEAPSHWGGIQQLMFIAPIHCKYERTWVWHTILAYTFLPRYDEWAGGGQTQLTTQTVMFTICGAGVPKSAQERDSILFTFSTFLSRISFMALQSPSNSALASSNLFFSSSSSGSSSPSLVTQTRFLPSYSFSCCTQYSSIGSTMYSTSKPRFLTRSTKAEFCTASRLSPEKVNKYQDDLVKNVILDQLNQ